MMGSVAKRRSKILEFEDALRRLPQVEEKLTHYFCKGLYARELFIPAGTALTGKIHLDETLNIVLSGRILVTHEEMEDAKILEAGSVFVSGPGIKKVGFALEDTRFLNVHPNPDDEKDMDALEHRYVVDDYNALEQRKQEQLT